MRSIARIWGSSMRNGAKLFQPNWQKDGTNSYGRIWKERINLSDHR